MSSLNKEKGQTYFNIFSDKFLSKTQTIQKSEQIFVHISASELYYERMVNLGINMD